jgi:hypothetical protein
MPVHAPQSVFSLWKNPPGSAAHLSLVVQSA